MDLVEQQKEIEQILQERVNLYEAEREVIQNNKNNLQIKIEELYKRFSTTKGRETIEELTSLIEKMEFTHATTSQSKAEERALLKSIEELKKRKKITAQNDSIKTDIEELRQQSSLLDEEIKEKNKSIDELTQGLYRVRCALNLHCGIHEIITEMFTIPEDGVRKVIGKDFKNIKAVEDSFGVKIILSNKKDLTIFGTTNAIQQAVVEISNNLNTTSEEFLLPDELIAILILEKGTLAKELQEKYQVKIDVHVAGKKCRVTGFFDNVTSTKEEIINIDGLKHSMKIVGEDLFKYIFGKDGNVIKELRESNHVRIDVSREQMKVDVLGRREDVIVAVAKLEQIISENKKVEETLTIDRKIFIACIIGKDGQTIRSISSTYGVSLQSTDNILKIIGNTERVANAKKHILDLIENYSNSAINIDIPDYCTPIILGKGGSKINALRKEHEGVDIDVVDGVVKIAGGDSESRAAAKLAIESIMFSNFTQTMPCDEEMCIYLKSYKCNNIRNQIVVDLKISMDIINETGLLRLRGVEANVVQGLKLLQSFISSIKTVSLELSKEDAISLLSIGSSTTEKEKSNTSEVQIESNIDLDALIFNPLKYVEVKFDVEAKFLKNEETKHLRIRGNNLNVDKANEWILGALNGNRECGSLILSVDPIVFSYVIGKNGSNLKKLESDFSVKIDVLKVSSRIRIRGLEKNLSSAENGIYEFMDNLRVSSSLKLPETLALLDDYIARTRKIFDIDIAIEIKDSFKFVNFRGNIFVVEEAKNYIQSLFQDNTSYTIKLPIQYRDSPRTNRVFQRLKSQYKVSIEVKYQIFEMKDESLLMLLGLVSGSPGSIKLPMLLIKGSVDSVENARLEIYNYLDSFLPSSIWKTFSIDSWAQLRNLFQQKKIRDLKSKVLALENVCIDFNDSYGCLKDLEVAVDLPLKCVRLSSSVPHVTIRCLDIIKQLQVDWEKLNFSIPIESFMIAFLFKTMNSKNLLQSLQEENDIHIQLNRNDMTLDIGANDINKLEQGVNVVKQRISELRSQYEEIQVDSQILKALKGVNGSNITKLRNELPATIDFDSINLLVKLSGSKDDVIISKEKVLAIIESEKLKSHQTKVFIPYTNIGKVIGVKGERINKIKSQFDVKFDYNDSTECATLSGIEESCVNAAKAIQDFFDHESINVNIFQLPVVKVQSIPKEEVSIESTLPRRVNPAVPSMIVKPVVLSKSAQKRLKKKSKQLEEAVDEVEANQTIASVPIASSVESEEASYDHDVVVVAPRRFPVIKVASPASPAPSVSPIPKKSDLKPQRNVPPSTKPVAQIIAPSTNSKTVNVLDNASVPVVQPILGSTTSIPSTMTSIKEAPGLQHNMNPSLSKNRMSDKELLSLLGPSTPKLNEKREKTDLSSISTDSMIEMLLKPTMPTNPTPIQAIPKPSPYIPPRPAFNLVPGAIDSSSSHYQGAQRATPKGTSSSTFHKSNSHVPSNNTYKGQQTQETRGNRDINQPWRATK